MLRHSTSAISVLLALTCACGSSSNGADASGAGARHGGDGGAGGSSGSGAGDESGGTSGSLAGGNHGGSTSGGSSPGGSSSGGTQRGGSSTGGTSTGGSAKGGGGTGGDAGAPECASFSKSEWRALPAANAPSAREEPWLVPTDEGMLVFGGFDAFTQAPDPLLDDGAIYRVCDDSWTRMSTTGVPHGITDKVAQRPVGVWTGSELLVWGGFQSPSGGYEEGEAVSFATRYSAADDVWSDISRDGEPTARDYSVRLWTGDELLVWGGIAQSGDQSWVNHDDGALYDPKSNGWKAMSSSAAPAGRYAVDRSVWTGEKLIVWGGASYESGSTFSPIVTSLDDGGIYDRKSDAWTPIASEGAPHGGMSPFAWSGKELIVISNLDGYSMPGQILFEGARLDPNANVWSAMSAPSLDLADTLEFPNLKLYWVGDVLAVFGVKVDQGSFGPALLLYDPDTDAWESGTVPATPSFFNWQSVSVVGDRLVAVGPGLGSNDDRGAQHDSTAIAVFDGRARTWTIVPEALERSRPGVVVQPERLLAWGGMDIYPDLDAPNPCSGAMGPCDPVTPTIQALLATGVGISY